MGFLIERVLLIPQKILPLAAGDVMHAMRASDEGFVGFGEAYFSQIKPGATKAWKRHRNMTLNLVVPVGRVAVGVIDADAGRGRIYELGPDKYARLSIPAGLWTGFRGISSEVSVMLNIADIEHDPAESDRVSESDFCFSWDACPYPCGQGQDVR